MFPACYGVCAMSVMWSTDRTVRRIFTVGLLLAAAASTQPVAAQNFVPGTGKQQSKVGDDLEDPKWTFNYNLPKSSFENDDQQRLPGGNSANGRFSEGVKRGEPDLIRRVPTPDDGIPGSTGALLMRSKNTGVPGRYSGQHQQDDLIVSVGSRIGGYIPVSRSPSVVVRVYIPPFDEWEQRNGPSFGFRATCQAYMPEKKKSRRGGGGGMKIDSYWPGMFLNFDKGDGKKTPDGCTLLIRGGSIGNDFLAKRITEPGWWTLGMSFSPDGQIHYYGHPGVEDLTAKDHLSSQFPYGFRALQMDSFFFNIVSGDNGNWSTPWIIDDPALYTQSSVASRGSSRQ